MQSVLNVHQYLRQVLHDHGLRTRGLWATILGLNSIVVYPLDLTSSITLIYYVPCLRSSFSIYRSGPDFYKNTKGNSTHAHEYNSGKDVGGVWSGATLKSICGL